MSRGAARAPSHAVVAEYGPKIASPAATAWDGAHDLLLDAGHRRQQGGQPSHTTGFVVGEDDANKRGGVHGDNLIGAALPSPAAGAP